MKLPCPSCLEYALLSPALPKPKDRLVCLACGKRVLFGDLESAAPKARKVAESTSGTGKRSESRGHPTRH